MKQLERLKGLKLTGKYLLSVIITAIFAVATVSVAVAGFNAPGNIEKSETLLSYKLEGNLSHNAYGYLTEDSDVCIACGGNTLVYFPSIIDTATGFYTYEFISDNEISDKNTTIEITALLSRSGIWSKQMVVLPRQEVTDTTVSFPFDSQYYLDLANTINEELGLGNVSTVDVIFIADIQTQATINGNTISDTLSQSCSVNISAKTIEWAMPLDVLQKGYKSDTAYEQRGRFGYEFNLLSNTLFGSTTLTSPSPDIKTLRKLPSANTYQSDVIGKMDVNLAYSLASEEIIGGINHEVNATVILSSLDGEQVLFPILTNQEFPGDLTIKLPIDIDLCYDLINKMENTTDYDFKATYNLTAKVDIHTTATEPASIDETTSFILPMEITSSGITIKDASDDAKTGSITSTTLVQNKDRSTLLMISLSLLLITIVLIMWTGWQIWESRRTPSLIGDLWEAAQSIVEKHKDIFVNVAEIPPQGDTDKVTQIGTLQDLVKLSDSLLKPVLHHQNEGRHTYFVIDSNIRYIFGVIEPPAR